jgi:hypothetical protein
MKRTAFRTIRIRLTFGLIFVGLFLTIPALAQERELTPAEQKAADMRIPELDRSAMEPERREPATVVEGERNPFGLVSLPPEEVEEVEQIASETEEMRIRRILANMRISGVSGSPGSYRVVLGSMQLKDGDTLPKLFVDQAEVLRVQSIGDREIILAFEEKAPGLPARTIGLGYDLTPRPQSLLSGELFKKLVPFTPKGSPDLKPLEVPAVKAIAEGAEKSGLQGLTERSHELMGEATPRSSDESAPKKSD